MTTDGTAADRYQAPGQADDGTIIAARPTPRAFYALRQDGSLRNAPLLAPGNSCGTGPLDLDVTPTGLIVFQYVHSDYCFNPTPGNGPRSRVTFAFSDVPTGSATFPKHDNWTAPRWTPGTDFASMVAIGGGSIGIQGGGTVSPVAHEQPFGRADQVVRHQPHRQPRACRDDPSRRVAQPARAVAERRHPEVDQQHRHRSVHRRVLRGRRRRPALVPRRHPDRVGGAAGRLRLACPVVNGGTCVLQPKLVAAGGHDPAWGVADVQKPPVDPPARAAAAARKRRQ